jgi:hypothetical protein
MLANNENLKLGILFLIYAFTSINTGKPIEPNIIKNTIVMFLIILGSIGFPVLIEVKAYIKNRIPNFRFSIQIVK